MAKFIYNHRVQDTISDIESRASDIKESEIVLASNDEKIAFKNKSGNLVTVSSDAYNAEQIADFFDGAEYDSDNKKIVFKHGDEVKAEIDASDFIKDGMVDTVKIEDGKLKIIFNTASGKDEIDIELTDIFNPDNYYTKENVDELLAEKADTATTYTKVEVDSLLFKKTDREVVNGSNKALIFNESDGGGAKFENADGTHSYVGVNEGGANGIAAQIYAKNISTNIGTRIDINPNGMYYTVGSASTADRMVAENEIAVKGDFSGYYTQEEVDALLAEKENEITALNKANATLKNAVAEIGGNVEWAVPGEGKFTDLMKKNGTVKLTEDTTSATFTGGITSKNKTTLNLNGKNLTFSGATTNNPCIMTRGAEDITIMGKGTFDAAGRIAVEANGENSIINLSGTTGFFGAEPTYVTDRSGAELIYCYSGIINIYAGIFRNNGADKGFTLNCYDGNYRTGKAKIVVYGGKFYDFDPGNNAAEGPGTSFLAEGYHTEASTVVEEGVEHTIYTVKKD